MTPIYAPVCDYFYYKNSRWSMGLLDVLRHWWRTAGLRTRASTAVTRFGGIILTLLTAAGAGLLVEEWIQSRAAIRRISALALPLAALYVIGRGYQDSSAPRLQPHLIGC
jgi:hypothetical protein